jgi:hypothetical protein
MMPRRAAATGCEVFLAAVAILAAAAAVACSRSPKSPSTVASVETAPPIAPPATASADPAPSASAPDAPASAAPAASPVIIEPIYDGGYKNWGDWGWAKREVSGPGPAKVNFSAWGGWILVRSDLTMRPFGSLVFRVKEPAGEPEFLAAKITGAEGDGPEIKVTSQYRLPLGGAEAGWDEVRIPFAVLNPDALPFDRVVLRADRPTKDAWTLLDKIGLSRPDVASASAKARVSAVPPRPVAMGIMCSAPATRISPLIYGFAYDFQKAEDEPQWGFGGTIRRWGGNPTTRYNWRIHAWNLDSDWFFENKDVPPYTKFLGDDAAHGVASALTVPIMGWVAKDATSVGFPVSTLGAQEHTDQWNPEAGDGVAKGGKAIGSVPGRTSVAITPEWVKTWIQSIRANDARTGHRSVQQYILDNEPGIWHVTHRDVRTAPLSYDELVDRTIQYGTAVRQADPDAVIAGPAEYGWAGYLYSGKDTENNWAKADRKAHGDVPLIEYYLGKLREYEKQTGIRVLDVVDLHYYPQLDTSSGEGQKLGAARVRSTRSLWVADYVDESWIHDTIRLLPRMKEWIAKNYPGRGMSIGEWNFGGEETMSGGLAAAEALGRFAQFGVTSAFYWTVPPADSPARNAFLAYRNFDGRGGHFLGWALPTTPVDEPGVSLFASRDEEGKHVVAIALNLSSDTPVMAHIDASTCGSPSARQAYVLARGSHRIAPVAGDAPPAAAFDQLLPPYSITIIDLHSGNAMTGSLAQ